MPVLRRHRWLLPSLPLVVQAGSLHPDDLINWPLFGRTRTLNAATYCASTSSI